MTLSEDDETGNVCKPGAVPYQDHVNAFGGIDNFFTAML
jgi:hypothetical protein